MIEIISGVTAAIVIIILSRLLSKYFTTKLIAATILVAIVFIYIGFKKIGKTFAVNSVGALTHSAPALDLALDFEGL